MSGGYLCVEIPINVWRLVTRSRRGRTLSPIKHNVVHSHTRGAVPRTSSGTLSPRTTRQPIIQNGELNAFSSFPCVGLGRATWPRAEGQQLIKWPTATLRFRMRRQLPRPSPRCPQAPSHILTDPRVRIGEEQIRLDGLSVLV